MKLKARDQPLMPPMYLEAVDAMNLALQFLEEAPELDELADTADYNYVRHRLKKAILRLGGEPHGVT